MNPEYFIAGDTPTRRAAMIFCASLLFPPSKSCKKACETSCKSSVPDKHKIEGTYHSSHNCKASSCQLNVTICVVGYSRRLRHPVNQVDPGSILVRLDKPGVSFDAVTRCSSLVRSFARSHSRASWLPIASPAYEFRTQHHPITSYAFVEFRGA